MALTSGNSDEAIQGIILRVSASLSSRYIYFPLPRYLPFVANNNLFNSAFSNHLTAAPHFPDITILDSVPGNILYQTNNTLPDYFHVYNLISSSHFHFSFPYPYSYVNAAILINELGYWQVFVVCIKERYNPICRPENDNNIPMPLIFYVYSSKRRKWSCLDNNNSYLTHDQLLPNRRKPIHVEDNTIFLDLTVDFLIRFSYMNDYVDLLQKPTSSWESNSGKLDTTTRFGECNGWLHCARINPFNNQAEVLRMEEAVRKWRIVTTGKNENLRGKVVALHPLHENLLFMRSDVNDEILLVDIKQHMQGVVIGGKGPNCGPACFLRGMNDVLEAALEGGERLQRSACGILHPHENAEGPEGEIFIVSLSGKHLDLRF